jgi:hypothetical protein
MTTATAPASAPARTSAPSSTLTPARTLVLFTIAYAVVVLVVGIVPVNLMLRHFMRAGMPHIWRVSVVRLVVRSVVSGVACYALLRATGRARGTLASTTPGGMMTIGALMSGALAGALDVGAHRLAVWPLIHLAHRSSAASELASALITALVTIAVAAALLVRHTRTVAAAVDPAPQPA